MTGNAPQPGETPRTESEPWNFPDPNTAWWRVEQERDRAEALAEAAAARPRHPRRRAVPTTPAGELIPGAYDTVPAYAPEALDAHAAGAQDAAVAMDPPPALLVEAEQEPRIEQAEAAAAALAVEHTEPVPDPVERDHHRRPRDRWLPPGDVRQDDHKQDQETAEGYAVSTADKAQAEATAAPDTETAAAPGDDKDRVPDVMVLPEPETDRNRPTVALDRDAPPADQPDVPEQPTSRLGQVAAEAKRERMENHPFWLSDEERASAGNAWPAPEVRQRLATGTTSAGERRGQPPAPKPRRTRGPVAGLLGLVALALVASFFSWVSAEPFWLAAGHGDNGIATVGQCTGTGLTQRCQGAFAATDGSFVAEQVTLLGVRPESANTGAVTPARMVSRESRQAYAGDTGWLLHLRWTLGFVLVVLCGYGIAGMTGARRLETARARRNAVLISLAGPVLLLAGFLAAAY